LPAEVSKKTNNHRKEKKKKPDYGNGPFGAPVEEDGNNNEQNNENVKPKEVSTLEVSIDWKLEAERRAWLAAHNEDIVPVRGLFDGGSDITDVV
jgi:hypothetical protein